MAFVPVIGAIQIALHATHEGSQRVMVVNYKQQDPGHIPSQAELSAVASAFWGAISTAYRQAACSAINFDYVTARYMGSSTGPEGEYDIPQPQPGVRTGNPLPANCAGVISWRTSLIGRSYRGRTYTFGAGDIDADQSRFVVGMGTALANLAIAMGGFTGISGLVMNLAVLSRVKHSITVATSWIIDSLVDSMRTRLVDRGN